MANAGTLKFVVEVAADQATEAIKALSTAVNQAGVDMRTKLLGVGPAAKQAGTEIGSLGDKMRTFAREQRSEARTANFFVQELAQVVPMSGNIKVALGGVGAALVGGAGIASAIQLVTVGIGLLVAKFREASEAAAKFAADSAKAADDLDRRIAALRGGTGAEQANSERRLVAMQIEDRRELIATWEDQIRIERQLTGSDQNPQIIEQNEKRIAQAREEIAQLQRRAEKLAEIVALEVQIADAKEAERQKTEAQREAEEKRAKAIRDVTKAREDAIAAAKRQAMAEAATMTGYEEEGERAPEYQKLKAADYADEQARLNAQMRESITLSEQWGAALGNVLAKLAMGEITLGQAVAQVGQMVIQQVVQAAITSITAKAASAGAGAAESQASIPVVGPVLAVAAMGAVMSAVLGLLGSVPSARGGWDVPAGWNGLTMIHEKEMILDEPAANALRNGGGAAGTTVNVSVSPFADGRSVERAFTRHEGAIQRALRQAARRRRVS